MTTVAGERRIVTVLFADIVGSTAIGGRLGPERTKLLLDEVMRLLSAEVERFGGTVAQFIGDELYAVFGAPHAHEDDSERAVRAAVAIQTTLAAYAEEVNDAYGIELSCRIAINTGPVVIQPESEDPYNALGETVNVASRIQKLVEGGEIVVGPETKLQIEECFELEPLPEHELRGVGTSVASFRVLGALDSVAVAPAGPIVGRDFELQVLERTMDDLADGHGVIAAITGEPGIGKTRLTAEVRRRYGSRIRFLEGRAVSYAQRMPYWPIRELLRDWLSVSASSPEARVRLELKAGLGRLFGVEADGAYPFLANLLGLTLEPDAAQGIRELNRESVQRETFEFFAELVSRLARESALCLVLDDLHWADDATLELLEQTLPAADEAGVGIVLLYRSEREHGSWRLGERARQRFPHRYREIELRPLPEDASRALAASVAAAELPEPVATLLADRAGGNPFFLEEALRDLIERGSLRRDNGRLVLAIGIDELAVPTIVQGALQARIDRLDPGTADVLSYAAVIGRSFELPLLQAILPHGQVTAGLSELQRLDLIVEERRRPVPEYRFRHGLVQEVAYGSLLESRRRRLHQLVGAALEHLTWESPPYGLLARHFTEADIPEKAADYELKAGDAARALYANQEALDHYRQARAFLARIGDEERTRETLFRMALVHHLTFDFDQAEAEYDAAFCCRVDEPPSPETTETLETVISHPGAFAPSHVYSSEGMMITDHLFRGLVSLDGDMNVVPELADNFRVSSDGRTYLFRLREGLSWSDGVRLVADDFVYAWEHLTRGNLPTGFLLDDVEAVTALDDRTLEVRLKEPRSYFPFLVTSPWAFPWPRHRCEELGDAWREPENLVGNGPFVLGELTDDHALLTANPLWNRPRGNVGEIRFTFRKSRPSAVSEWLEGRHDVLLAFDRSAVGAPDTDTELFSTLSVHYVGFNAEQSPFSNVLVRQAFSHAVDRELLVPIFGEVPRPASRGGALPPAMPGHSHRIALEHDPQLARDLLARAGYPGGQGLPELELVVPAWVSDPTPLVSQWETIGARVRVQQKGAKEGIWGSSVADSDLWLSGWTADFPDPDGFFRGLFMRDEGPFHTDEELEELLLRARSLQDQGERMRLYHELDRLWVNERAAILPLSYGRVMLLSRPWVHGLATNALARTSFDRVSIDRRAGPAQEA